MAFKLGFATEQTENKVSKNTTTEQHSQVVPRKSVVQVYFADENRSLAYYNDKFDLHQGDLVFVDGKLEGKRGRITDVSYSFKIKVSDYQRVIAVADTNVKGQFFMSGSHFITFDRVALPREKAITWFKAPPKDDDEFVCGTDDDKFCLDRISDMEVSEAVAKRGHCYYVENRVRYISIDGNKGYAVVMGGEAYEVDFEYHNGEISHLSCTCFCTYRCKHEFATMIQLKETLELISKYYEDEYENSGYFAAVAKDTMLALAIDGKEKGSFTL